MNDKDVFYPAVNLYRVTCKKKGAEPRGFGDEGAFKNAYVMATSVETASLKAEAHFNEKGGGEFEASSVDLYASCGSKDNVFIG